MGGGVRPSLGEAWTAMSGCVGGASEANRCGRWRRIRLVHKLNVASSFAQLLRQGEWLVPWCLYKWPKVSAEHGKEERVPCFGDEGGLSHSSSGVSFEAIRAL